MVFWMKGSVSQPAIYLFICFLFNAFFCDDAWYGIMIHENKSITREFQFFLLYDDPTLNTALKRSFVWSCIGMIRYLTSRWRFKIKLIFITEDVFSLFVSLPNVYHACITKIVLTFSRWVSLRIKDGGYPLIFPCKL